MFPMRHRNVTALVIVIIAALLLCPISEMFDHWDHSGRTHKDTESSLMMLAECAGAAIAILHAGSSFLPRLIEGKPVVVRRTARFRSVSFEPRVHHPPESPPLLPLRI